MQCSASNHGSDVDGDASIFAHGMIDHSWDFMNCSSGLNFL